MYATYCSPSWLTTWRFTSLSWRLLKNCLGLPATSAAAAVVARDVASAVGTRTTGAGSWAVDEVDALPSGMVRAMDPATVTATRPADSATVRFNGAPCAIVRDTDPGCARSCMPQSEGCARLTSGPSLKSHKERRQYR